jgi:hypothetical protein
MSGAPQWVHDALSDVYGPCCSEKGIPVMDIGLLRSVRDTGGKVRVELLLTSGCGMDVEETKTRLGGTARA